MRSTSIFPGVLAASAVLLIVACAPAEQGRAVEERTSLLQSALTVVTTSDTSELADLHQVREVEAEISDCMKSRGFEYIPFVDSSRVDPTREPLGALPVAEYGFGISTRYFTDRQVPSGLAARPESSRATNPNIAIRQALGDRERNAYDDALNGTVDSDLVPGVAAEGVTPFDPEACRQRSTRLVLAESDFARMMQEFGDELSQFRDRINAHEELVTFDQTFTECMQTEGHSWEGLESLRSTLVERLAALPLTNPPEFEMPDGVDPLGSPEEFGSSLRAQMILASDAHQELARIQETEVAIALAAIDCGLDRRAEVAATVQDAIIAEFDAAYSERLEALGI